MITKLKKIKLCYQTYVQLLTAWKPILKRQALVRKERLLYSRGQQPEEKVDSRPQTKCEDSAWSWKFVKGESFGKQGQSFCSLLLYAGFLLIVGEVTGWGSRDLVLSLKLPSSTWVEALVPTELGRAKAKRVLSRERTGHRKHPFPTTQEMTLHIDITKWSILKSDWLYSLQLKMEKKKQSAKTRSGADCDSDHELLIEKFRLNWRK